MTRAAFEQVVRRHFEELTGDGQERAALRALGRAVFVWHNLSSAELERVSGAVMAVRLLDS